MHDIIPYARNVTESSVHRPSSDFKRKALNILQDNAKLNKESTGKSSDIMDVLMQGGEESPVGIQKNIIHNITRLEEPVAVLEYITESLRVILDHLSSRAMAPVDMARANSSSLISDCEPTLNPPTSNSPLSLLKQSIPEEEHDLALTKRGGKRPRGK
ncbi:hypothetical protein EV356DRAFT_514683 [Viridothelium virens]|uniref:Uncharacterized protein n=1 Tax=Viridothelium virens TaxID=1048519 RepID=A0A6A6HAK9_VIRVR|nr:hypothetical protein EV356DRAFT_514683 [Viridothelium virens]